jgi:hypothetical protein
MPFPPIAAVDSQKEGALDEASLAPWMKKNRGDPEKAKAAWQYIRAHATYTSKP